ncbi:hypothetical protein ENUP19_0121G0192 [Entamoeba nuttalli]|uniref:Heat shock protein 70 n=1 Tax=Entamoeba nuttalli TaxID=412467 RepID=A0ABQ0DJ21_9EUKA
MESIVDFFTQLVSIGIPKPTAICEVKRFIGRKFDDRQVQGYIRQIYFLYEIVGADDGYCRIVLEPEFISATILKAIKIEIQRRLNISSSIVLKAVVTVSAYFDDSQKDVFGLIRLLAKPLAAVYAYGLDFKKSLMCLVFDLGGGMLDTTILENQENDFNFKAIGGSDCWTQCDIKKQLKYNLRKGVEKAKIALSTNLYCELDISELALKFSLYKIDDSDDDEELIISLDINDFEECNKKEFDKCMECIDEIMQKKGISISQIEEVILVGGNS